MSPPTPPSPPIISRHLREEEENKSSNSRSRHRSTRDYRASRSKSRGRGRSSRLSPDRERKHKNHRTHSRSRSRSRDASRYHKRNSPVRHRYDRSRSKSKIRSDRHRRNTHRSRSRSYSRAHKSRTHRSKSRSRSHSRSRRRHNRSRSSSKSHRARDTRSRSKRREDKIEGSKNQQPNVIVLSTESYKDSLKSTKSLPSVREDKEPASSSSASTSTSRKPPSEETPSWKRAKIDQIGVYSNLEPDAPIDKEKIHKDIEEKLRLALAREGKVYPYPKPEPSHPVFANDGSFLEIFKKMQQQQTFVQQQVGESMQIHAVPTPPVVSTIPAPSINHQPPPPQLPIFGRRRGGKILKTGVVAKPKASNDTDTSDVKDFWSIYLREVKKYKSTACESDSKTRPLVR